MARQHQPQHPLVAAVAQEMKAARLKAGYRSQQALADAAGVGIATVQRIEGGQRAADASQLGHLCAALGVLPSEIWRRAEARVFTSAAMDEEPPLDAAARRTGRLPAREHERARQDSDTETISGADLGEEMA